MLLDLQIAENTGERNEHNVKNLKMNLQKQLKET